MTLKNIVVALAAGIALASSLAARAEEYNDGTYIWGFYASVNDDNERVASLSDVRRVDEQKIEGAITFPATVSLTVTNELGYSKWDVATGKYTWVSTRPQKIETLTFRVETISWNGFRLKDVVHEEQWGSWTSKEYQRDPLITSITIPDGVKFVYNLNDACLANVTAVSFPSTVEVINSCFCFCDKLASVSVPEDAYIAEAFIGTPWARSKGDFFVWNGNLIRYQGTDTDVVVPEEVKTLGTAAFAPYYWEGFTEEQGEMFASAINITSVKLPSSLEEIGDSAFTGCEKLASINIPDRVYSIGSRAFSQCKKLASIDIPNGVYFIGDGAFESTALTAIALPKSIRVLRSSAFAYTAISSLAIPEGLQYLEGTCASMTNLTSVTIPATAEYFMYTFADCKKLTAVDIPDSVVDVQPNTFQGCESLTSVTGGAGLKSVVSNAFGSDPHWDDEKQESVAGTGVPFYDNAPEGFRVLGPVAYGYKGDLPEDLTVPAGVKYVMNYLTSGNDKSAVKTITLSEGVETIGYFAFEYCDNLETVNLGNTVTNLGGYAFCQDGYNFYRQGKLATVTGGAALEVGRDAFNGTQFKKDTATRAGNEEPFGLIRLGKVVLGYKGRFAAGEFNIPADVTEFGLYGSDWSTANVTALTGGASLKGSLKPNDFEKLQRVDVEGAIGGELDCSGMAELTDVNLPNAKLSRIDEVHFEGCTDLMNVTVGLDPEEVEYGWVSISSAAFRQCDKLQSVNVVCKGYKVKVEGAFETGNETFANELSTFKYGGERVDFETDSWSGEFDGWRPFSLIPTLVKAPAGSYLVVFQSEGETSYERTFARNHVDALPPPRFTRPRPEGKTFKGWAGDNGRRYDDGILIFNAAEEGGVLTLTAIWGE